MNKKSLLLVFSGYVLWGLLPLYWGLLSQLNSLFVLANRVLWSAIFTFLALLLWKKASQVRAVLKDKQKMKFLLPASIIITLNWGVYIWAVSSGRVLNASLGYYMNPLAVFLCGIFVFHERCGKIELLALALAAIGVILSTIQFGQFPLVALLLAVLFAAYGILKKFAQVDGLTGVCVEAMLTAPVALLFLFFAPQSHQTFSTITPALALLCVGSGIATALPMSVYSQGINDLPFITMGFLQYITPTLMLGISLFNGEAFGSAKAVSFGFIWVSLIIFTTGMVIRERKSKEKVTESR